MMRQPRPVPRSLDEIQCQLCCRCTESVDMYRDTVKDDVFLCYDCMYATNEEWKHLNIIRLGVEEEKHGNT